MKIYTKTGDKGETGILGKGRLLKSHIRIEAYGTIDELNSILGLSNNYTSVEVKEIILNLQNLLFEIGSELASDKISSKIYEKDIKDLEIQIDKYSEKLPTLKAFILPGGSESSTWLHLSRTIARRAERRIVDLAQTIEINPHTIAYINRVSDLLFVLARYENYISSIPDVEWKSRS